MERVRTATDADKVDIVGHSEGSLMPDYYVKFLGGDEAVDRYVGMTPLWDGTRLLGASDLDHLGRAFGIAPVYGGALGPLCGSCREFLRGSDFLAKMQSDGGPKVDGVTYTMIMTKYDELVMPYTGGELEGAKNVVLQDVCPADVSEHAGGGLRPGERPGRAQRPGPGQRATGPLRRAAPVGAPGLYRGAVQEGTT